ncbi:hypothetical protein ACH42_06435 [Endozoicomonas sp. (ex Bugula neritina AB1)]|nr:hypothetical protein ACH42_06435 [Endozoicomonas sp. (ex Bugula neritina AB1)]
MADNLINTSDLVEKTLDTPQEGGFSNPEQPDAEAVGKFEDLVSDQPGVKGIQTEDLSVSLDAAQKTNASALTLGDKVLQGMQGLREHVEMKSDAVKMQLQPSDESLSMRQMFQTQMAMTNLMVTEDYIGKIVSKSTQTFDTLLRNQ